MKERSPTVAASSSALTRVLAACASQMLGICLDKNEIADANSYWSSQLNDITFDEVVPTSLVKAKDYGRCIAEKVPEIENNLCYKEFLALRSCMQTVDESNIVLSSVQFIRLSDIDIGLFQCDQCCSQILRRFG
ncbi:hypothetical protein GUJ93_ZPchr0012g21404 [Zizania palustris]|uniref:Uncharacterized protein n=1 Tax=Zizania palustris TaxID=103762 RepID=A0A8J5WQ18_ZIZPA|nr:hypothetical protein GUJ93_ZPchr0012g21404 [Zizania palustris]